MKFYETSTSYALLPLCRFSLSDNETAKGVERNHFKEWRKKRVPLELAFWQDYKVAVKYIRTIFSIFFIFFSVLFAVQVRAENLGFYIIHPDGEGDADAAKPFLAGLFDYLNELTQIKVDGLYLNDSDEAVEALKQNKIQLAIVSPEFFESFKDTYSMTQVLKTIPIYSNGAYERYYILADKGTNILSLMDQQISVNLFASKAYEESFLNDKIFLGNDEIKKIPWKLQETDDIINAISIIAEGKANTFVLLTGYEFSVVSKLKKSNPDFAKLKLVYTSRELPSSMIVTIGKNKSQNIDKIKEAMLGMATSLRGNIILKNLRLKGFANL